MTKPTYEPIVDTFPLSYTVEDLRNLYIKLRPLFAEEEIEESHSGKRRIKKERLSERAASFVIVHDLSG